MSLAKDLRNEYIGYWKIEKIAFSRGDNNYWRCRCDRCGNTKIYLESFLRSGRIPVCRCRPSQDTVKSYEKRHKIIRKMLYREWAELVRKFNPSDKCYPNWGGAGLKLCKKWTEFSNFKEDMQQLYKLGEKLYIKNVPDLILNNKTVSKDTCIWAKTRKNQESIQSYYVKYYGKDTLLNEIYNRFHKDLSYNTVYQRIARYKWPVMKALKASAPKKKKKTARNEQKVENKSE